MWRCEVNDAEKIEALRKLFDNIDGNISELFGIPVEVLDSIPPNTVLLVSRDVWEQIRGRRSLTDGGAA